MFILIILMSGLTNIPHIEFNTIQSCELAGQSINNISKYNKIKYVCVEK